MPSRERGPLAGASNPYYALSVMTDPSRRATHSFERLTARILGLLVFSLFLQTAGALDPSRSIKQFDHTSWTVRRGAPSGIAALAQTADGLLWLATPSGVVRFDGVTFEAFRPITGPAFPQSDISTLMATVDGGLWIGYRLGGCSFMKNGVLTNYSFPEGTVWDFKVGNDGVVWMGGAFAGGLARLIRGEWTRVGIGLGYTPSAANRILFDRRGDLWVQSPDGIWVLRHGANHVQETGMRSDTGAPLAEASDGSLMWLDRRGVARLSKLDAPMAKIVGHPILAKSHSMLLVDRDGALWAFAHNEVLRLPSSTQASTGSTLRRTQTLQHISTQDGLINGYVTSAIEDREGNIWVATPNGLDRFRMTSFTPVLLGKYAAFGFAISPAKNGKVFVGTAIYNVLSVQDSDVTSVAGPKMTDIGCLYPSPDGKLWIGGFGELGYLKGGRYTTVSLPPESKRLQLSVQALTYDKDGSLWVSTIKRTIAVLKNGRWTELEQVNGFPRTAVSLFTDGEGRVWAGYMGGKIVVYEGGLITKYSENDGLTVGNVTTINETGSGIWVAGQYGVNLFRGGHFVPIRFRDNFEVGGVTGIVEGSDGSLWMNTKSGIVSVPGEEIREFLKSYDHPVSFTRYDVLDGLNGNAAQLRPLPSAILATDGRLWFALDGDVVYIDPLHVFRSKMIPPVSIIRVKSGAELQQTGDLVHLDKKAHDIEIDYTAGSLSIPERVNFKYRMDDGDWESAGTRRQAFFTYLAPGQHRFQVLASNGYGVWNETGATIIILRPPTFQESIWFKLLWIVVGSLAIWAAFYVRMRQMILKVQVRMSERLVERERIARDLHDTLLQGFQGVLLRFQTISKRLTVDTKVQHEMEDTISRADQVLTEARDKVWQLRASSRPSGDLASCLSTAAGDLSAQWPTDFSLHVVGTPQPLLADAFEEICAITQEALANAFRHSEAQAIEVELQFGQSEFRARIRDSGKGLPANALERSENTKHWGLLGMQERAKKLGANFTMRRQQRGGTEVQLTVPASLCYRSTSSNWKRHFRGGSI